MGVVETKTVVRRKNGYEYIQTWVKEADCWYCSDIKMVPEEPVTVATERVYAVALPEVDRVIFNPPATIVYWTDKTRTVVKCQNGELFDEEAGFVMAFVKKVLGDRYKSVIRKSIKNAYRQMPKKTGSPIKSGTVVLGVSGSYRNIGVSLDDCLDQMSGFINSGEKDV